jgi:hypothetical protein
MEEDAVPSCVDRDLATVVCGSLPVLLLAVCVGGGAMGDLLKPVEAKRWNGAPAA